MLEIIGMVLIALAAAAGAAIGNVINVTVKPEPEPEWVFDRDRYQALSDALVIVKKAATEVVNGPAAPWRFLYHTACYLEKQAALTLGKVIKK